MTKLDTDFYKQIGEKGRANRTTPYTFETNPDTAKLAGQRSGEARRKICPNCGQWRWKTKQKNIKWECRNCGFVKESNGS